MQHHLVEQVLWAKRPHIQEPPRWWHSPTCLIINFMYFWWYTPLFLLSCLALCTKSIYERIWLFNYIYCCLRESIRQSCSCLLSSGERWGDWPHRMNDIAQQCSVDFWFSQANPCFILWYLIELECALSMHATVACHGYFDISSFSSNETM